MSKFETLAGMKDREVPCHVLRAGDNDPAVGIYSLLRGNDLASEHQAKQKLHELIYVFSYLKASYSDHKKAVEIVVERIQG